MKKYLLIMLACLGVIFTTNADGRRTCPVYNSQYTATLVSGSTMVSGDSPWVTIAVEGTKQVLGPFETVKVWVNALDRSTGYVVDTIEISVAVQHGKTRGSKSGQFKNLKKGVYYNVSIDSASCE